MPKSAPKSDSAASASHEVRDPVCGKPVDPLRARAVGIYAGVTRYFCSQDCKAKFADPRVKPGSGPNGVERRWSGEQPMGTMPSSNSNEWFVRGEADSKAPVAKAPDRFHDLEERPTVDTEIAPSPSLMIEVEASKRGPGRWIILGVAVVGALLLAYLGLR